MMGSGQLVHAVDLTTRDWLVGSSLIFRIIQTQRRFGRSKSLKETESSEVCQGWYVPGLRPSCPSRGWARESLRLRGIGGDSWTTLKQTCGQAASSSVPAPHRSRVVLVGARRDARRLIRSLGRDRGADCRSSDSSTRVMPDPRACGPEAGIWPSIPRLIPSPCWARSIASMSWWTAPAPPTWLWPFRQSRTSTLGRTSPNLSSPTSPCIGSWSIQAGSTWRRSPAAPHPHPGPRPRKSQPDGSVASPAWDRLTRARSAKRILDCSHRRAGLVRARAFVCRGRPWRSWSPRAGRSSTPSSAWGMGGVASA